MSGFPTPTTVYSTGGGLPNQAGNPLAPALSIGSVVFLNDEHPFKMAIPLDERIAVHELIGGGRSVQSTGVQPADITWSGTLWDQQAQTKMATLKTMQKLGTPQTFSWLDQVFSVIIKTVTATVVHQWRYEYEIVCVVVSDNSGSYSTPSTASVDSQTTNLFTTAQANVQTLQALPTTNGISLPSTIPGAVTTLGTLIQTAGPLAQASTSSVTAIVAQGSTIQNTLAPYITSLNTQAGTYSGVIPSTLQQTMVAASSLNSAVSLISANAQIGQAPRFVTVGGGISLYQVAAQYYGDANLASVIKQTNQLTSMQLPAGVPIRLQLPPATPNPLA